jgi:hypothetical protein
LIVIKSANAIILGAIAQAQRNYFFNIIEHANKKELRAVIVVEQVGGKEQKAIQLIFNEKVVGQFPDLEPALLQISYFISQVCIYGLSGVVKIHGASLAKEGNVLVVSANKYAGKSSLSVAFGLTGTQVLTDELTILNPENHEIWPFPRRIALSSRAHKNLSLSGLNLNLRENGPSIYSFNQDLSRQRYTLKTVVLLTRSRKHRLDLRKISSSVGQKLLSQNLFDTPPKFMLNAIDCFRLHASDLKDVVHAIQGLMGDY